MKQKVESGTTFLHSLIWISDELEQIWKWMADTDFCQILISISVVN